jgi:hypothetical protein
VSKSLWEDATLYPDRQTSFVTPPRPFTYEFEMNRRRPLAFHILDAKRPLVMAHQPYAEMREDFVQTARSIRCPSLYLDGVSLAAMGGEPYADWY